jgi:hypothetical protein
VTDDCESAATIAGSVANNVGLNRRQLQLIPVEKCADCRFAHFRLQAATLSVRFFPDSATTFYIIVWKDINLDGV